MAQKQLGNLNFEKSCFSIRITTELNITFSRKQGETSIIFSKNKKAITFSDYEWAKMIRLLNELQTAKHFVEGNIIIDYSVKSDTCNIMREGLN